ncbi:MAG: translocation/assembly module TamB domain-containing protein, partial [Planctomycetota bacterium]
RGVPEGKLGSLRGQLSANGTLGAKESTPDQQQPVALELELAEFAEASSSLNIRQLELRSGDEVLLRGGGLLTWGEKTSGASRDPFTAELEITEIADLLPAGGLPALIPGAPDVSGPLSGRISWESSPSSKAESTLELRSPALQLRFTGASGETALLGPARLEGLARLRGGSLAIEQLTLADEAAAFTLEGYGSVSKGAETSGSDSPLLDLSAEIHLAEISGLSGPLSALLGMRLPLRAGSLRGTAEWKGPLDSPTLSSQLLLEEGVLALGAPLPAATAVVAELQLNPGQLKIERLEGELGASPFTLVGHIDLPRGASPELDLQLEGDNLLFARSRTLRVRADADLTLQGTVEELHAKGTLLLRGGRLTAPVEFLDFSRRGASTRSEAARGLQIFSLPEPPLSNMRFDVQVRTAEPFSIDNNVAKGAVRPSLQLRGTGEVPLLEGEVFLDPTVVSLPATRLQVNSGRVDFDRSDPFYPTLAIQGSSRIRGIDIEARVAGRFDEPEIFLSSTPAQPGEDLVY